MIISVDIGYGYTKALNEAGNSIIFPSLVSQARNRDMEGIFGADDSGIDSLHVMINGEEFFVGELARRSGSATFTLDAEKIEHRNTDVLLATAVAMLADSGKEGLYIASGLPYQEYLHRKDDFRRKIKGMRAQVAFYGGPQKGKKKYFSIDDALVFPQAAGAVYAGTDLRELSEIAGTGRLLSVVDIGYKTTDVVTFEAGEKFRLRQDTSGTLDAGASDLETRIKDIFWEKTGRRIDHTLIAGLIEKGGIHFRGKFINLENEIIEAKKELTQRIIDGVHLIWRDMTDYIYRIYLAGGGALLLDDMLKNIHFNSKLMKDAQRANSIGFLEVAKIKKKRRCHTS